LALTILEIGRVWFGEFVTKIEIDLSTHLGCSGEIGWGMVLWDIVCERSKLFWKARKIKVGHPFDGLTQVRLLHFT
jgi:hypothetical protein